MTKTTDPKVGLVLSGGGARGAYQVGVLKALGEILADQQTPFQTFSGVSAGSINCAYLASRALHFDLATQSLWDLWNGLSFQNVFQVKSGSFLKRGSMLAKALIGGGFFQTLSSTYLLDNHPLHGLLQEHVDFENIKYLIAQKKITGIAITATNYKTGTAVTFYDENNHTQDWFRSHRMAKKAKINIEHILASSAVPFFFPPTFVDHSYYGDGSMRFRNPLSPAVHMGSEKIFAIGVRIPRSPEKTKQLNQQASDKIVLADLIGTMLNAMFLDSLDTDIQRLTQINRFVEKSKDNSYRSIPIFSIYPSKDLGDVSSETIEHFPRMFRYLLKGLGVSNHRGTELLSYLSFHHEYTSQLLALGYKDAYAKKDAIKTFFKQD